VRGGGLPLLLDQWRAFTSLLWAVLAISVSAPGCSRHPSRPEVVLYSSVDDHLLRQVARAFEQESGIAVRIVGDTEATKTTGLVERLIAEKGRPRADVWWSSEPLGSIRLASEGVLEPFTPGAEKDFEGGWPAQYRATDRAWYAFACRARVIVYSTRKLAGDPPRTLAALAEPRLAGRIGMARPQFGTTRTHIGALLAESGEPVFRAWLGALKASGVRLYDGNAAVARAVAYGEIDAGLTDSDDVYAGQREGWPIEMVPAPATLAPGGGAGAGPMLLPNTVGRVRGAPHPAEGGALAEFLLSARVERMLAESESRNVPIRPALARDLRLEIPGAAVPDLQRAAQAAPAALQLVDELFR
jgi:iron(III) transport system substrate-binding protein